MNKDRDWTRSYIHQRVEPKTESPISRPKTNKEKVEFPNDLTCSVCLKGILMKRYYEELTDIANRYSIVCSNCGVTVGIGID